MPMSQTLPSSPLSCTAPSPPTATVHNHRYNKFNKWKYEILQLQRNDPTHQDMLGADELGRSLAEKGLGVLLDTKITMRQQRKPTSSLAVL